MVHAVYLTGGLLFAILTFLFGCFLGKIVGHDRGYRAGERDGRRPNVEQLTSLRLQLASMKAERDQAFDARDRLFKQLNVGTEHTYGERT